MFNNNFINNIVRSMMALCVVANGWSSGGDVGEMNMKKSYAEAVKGGGEKCVNGDQSDSPLSSSIISANSDNIDEVSEPQGRVDSDGRVPPEPKLNPSIISTKEKISEGKFQGMTKSHGKEKERQLCKKSTDSDENYDWLVERFKGNMSITTLANQIYLAESAKNVEVLLHILDKYQYSKSDVVNLSLGLTLAMQKFGEITLPSNLNQAINGVYQQAPECNVQNKKAETQADKLLAIYDKYYKYY